MFSRNPLEKTHQFPTPVTPRVSGRPFLPTSFFFHRLPRRDFGFWGRRHCFFFEGSLTGQHRYILDNCMWSAKESWLRSKQWVWVARFCLAHVGIFHPSTCMDIFVVLLDPDSTMVIITITPWKVKISWILKLGGQLLGVYSIHIYIYSL